MPKKQLFLTKIKASHLVQTTYLYTEKCAKRLRHDLVPIMRQKADDVLSNVILANRLSVGNQLRLQYQQLAQGSLDIFDEYAHICKLQSYVTNSQFDNLMTISHDLHGMIENWIKSDCACASDMK